MFLIGEFSKLTQVSLRMLRYYDENNLLKPSKIDPSTGYRYYSSHQIPELHKIILLRDFGYNIAEIKRIKDNWSPDYLREKLSEKKKEIKNQIEIELQRLLRLEDTLAHLGEEEMKLRYNIGIKQVPGYPVISLRKTIPDYFHEGLLWKELTDYAQQAGLPVDYRSPSFGRYHDVDYKEQDVDVEVCVIIDHLADVPEPLTCYVTEAEEHMASTLVYGPFENINDAFLSFADFLSHNLQYRMKSPTRQICHRGPWNEDNPNNYLTEIQIPLKIIA